MRQWKRTQQWGRLWKVARGKWQPHENFMGPCGSITDENVKEILGEDIVAIRNLKSMAVLDNDESGLWEPVQSKDKGGYIQEQMAKMEGLPQKVLYEWSEKNGRFPWNHDAQYVDIDWKQAMDTLITEFVKGPGNHVVRHCAHNIPMSKIRERLVEAGFGSTKGYLKKLADVLLCTDQAIVDAEDALRTGKQKTCSDTLLKKFKAIVELLNVSTFTKGNAKTCSSISAWGSDEIGRLLKKAGGWRILKSDTNAVGNWAWTRWCWALI